MRIPERYLLSLATTYAVTNFALAFYAGTTLDLYVSIFIVEYFILTLLYSPLNLKTQRITNIISYVLFTAFLLIVSLKVMQILGVTLP